MKGVSKNGHYCTIFDEKCPSKLPRSQSRKLMGYNPLLCAEMP